MQAFIQSLLGFLALLAASTKTKVDDEAVELLKAIEADETVRSWFTGVYSSAPPEGTLSITAEPPLAVAEALRNRGFEWSKVVELLPVVISLLRAFAGK